MADVSPGTNAPVTAAVITAAIGGVLAAFTSLDAEQVAAVNAVVLIVAGFVLQKFHVNPKGVQ
jgi:hypothetical protein